MQISSAGTRIVVHSPASNGGRASVGRPCGTTPRMPTPRASSPRPQTAAVVATMVIAGPTFARMSASRSPSPNAEQEGFEAAARPQEKDERGEADRRGIGIDLGEAGHHRLQNVQQIFAFRADAEERTDLACRDLDGRGRDEARDDRVAEEIREKPEPQHPHRDQQDPGDHRERDGRPQILRRSLGGDLSRGGRGHEAGHRHGADRQRTRGAEDRIERERRHRGVEPDLRGQPHHQRIGERLRDQHDRHDRRGDQVAGERPGGVFGPPGQDREIAAEQVGEGPALVHRHTLRPRTPGPLVGSSPEKESSYLVLSQHPPQLLDAEEGDKSNENDQGIGEDFIGSFPEEVNDATREPLPLPKALDPMLDQGKDGNKESEDDRLVKGGINQGLPFKAATEAGHLSDHDDFRENQRFDHGKPVIRVRDVVGGQQEPSVLRESGEHEGEITDIYPVLDHLVDDLFLQVPFFLISAAHNPGPSHEISMISKLHSFRFPRWIVVHSSPAILSIRREDRT